MKLTKPVLMALVAIFLLSVSACNSNRKGASSGKPAVTVSIPPVKYLVDKLSGNEYEVNTMVATGACQETFEPTPVQMKEVSKSVAYFGISDLEFEQKWIDNIKTNNKGLRYKNLAEGIYEAEEACSHDGAHDHDHAHAHAHGGKDPHFWLSAANYKAMAKATFDELTAINPAHKEKYAANLNRLLAAIDSVDANAKRKLTALPVKAFIIYHPALTYFAEDYGLEQISIEKDGKEPDAGYIKQLVSRAKALGIKKIFVQKEFDMSIIRSFAKEIGAEIVPINTFEYDWVKNMNEIIETLHTAGK